MDSCFIFFTSLTFIINKIIIIVIYSENIWEILKINKRLLSKKTTKIIIYNKTNFFFLKKIKYWKNNNFYRNLKTL